MKKVLLLILLLFIPLVSAVNINLKSNFLPGETLLATIEGNFLSPITPDNIYFYSDREYLPITFDIAQIQEKYYLYALLPIKERNYTLIIKDAHYFENAQEQIRDLEKNFSVSGNITDFSVYPGFIITRGNFTISIESKNSPLDLSTVILNQSQVVHIPIGQSKKIDFSVQVSNFTLTTLSLFSAGTRYEIPTAILSGNKTQYLGNTTINITEASKFSFSRSEYNFSVNKGKSQVFSVYLKNLGEKPIEDIKLELSTTLKQVASLSPSELDLNESNQKEIRLEITTDSIGTVIGRIKAESGNLSTSSEIIITSLSEETPLPTPTPSQEKEPCIYYGGTPCSSNQACTGQQIESSDSPSCCIGTCTAKKSYTGLVIGIILLLAVGIGLFFLYKKSKAKKASSKEIIEQKTNAFEKRFSGTEVRGDLARS